MSRKIVCKHTEGVGHDCAYVDWRNSKIPLAEAIADQEQGPRPHAGEISAWAKRWDAEFHRAMDRLTRDQFGMPVSGGARPLDERVIS